jgi:hypothetical protein
MQEFRREIDGGRSVVHLSFIEHQEDVDITVDVAIRFHAVEDLVNHFQTLLSDKEKSETHTLGSELGNLERGEPFRLTLANKDDVSRVAEEVVRKFMAIGMPYLEQYSRPEAAYSLLARDDREAWIHSPIHAERAKRACALLFVIGKRAEAHSLGVQKLSFLNSVNDPSSAAFSRFLDELARITH